MARKIIFLHGLESSGLAYKAGLIRRFFPELIAPDFTGSFRERMEQLYPTLGPDVGWTLIGSSFGGLMSAVFTCEKPQQVRMQVLLAPALMAPEFAPYLDGKPVSVPTTVIHGRGDEVVPLREVREIAERVFSNLTYQVVDDDHSLHRTSDSLDWKTLLS